MPLPPARPGSVLILGASMGIGRSVALSAAENGFPVTVGCRKIEDGQRVVRQIAALGGRATPVSVDVTDYHSVEAAVEAAAAVGGGLAGLVNNAAIIDPIARLGDTDPGHWAHAIQVNLVGPYHGTRAALPRLLEGGVVVNLSSGAATTAVEGWSAYCASKAGLAMLTRSTFLEYGHRARVYGVQPGMVDTDMQAEIRASGIGAASRYPKRHLSLPSIAGRAIGWLLREAPQDLSGTEVDLEAVTLRLRRGRQGAGEI